MRTHQVSHIVDPQDHDVFGGDHFGARGLDLRTGGYGLKNAAGLLAAGARVRRNMTRPDMARFAMFLLALGVVPGAVAEGTCAVRLGDGLMQVLSLAATAEDSPEAEGSGRPCTGSCEGKLCGDDDGCGVTCIVSDGCGDGNPCSADYCVPPGKCGHVPLDGDCDDGNACTLGDYCQNGSCASGGDSLDCSDLSSCTADSCDAAQGCLHLPMEGACTDGNSCTIGDKCQDGQCVSEAQADCNDYVDCTEDGCDPSTGCVHTALSGTPCDDQNPCTVDDSCAEGNCLPGEDEPICSAACGNGVCEIGEGFLGCPVDCGPCGDGLCGKNECWEGCELFPAAKPCAADCAPVCGNLQCDGGESSANCPADCGGCGDGICFGAETEELCPGDCHGPPCGDGFCAFGESPDTCLADCPPCGNGLCESGEDPEGCAFDCGPCGDGVCGVEESSLGFCPQDCETACGDGHCMAGENDVECPIDCGGCGDGLCGPQESFVACSQDCLAGCGDAACGPGENAANCPFDCGCLPKCEGKQCGDDGCGTGTLCGLCPEGQKCDESSGACE